jgi:dTDP-4-dehydrorhamnose reductase
VSDGLLVIGADGLLGSAVAAALRDAGHSVIATSRRRGAETPLDLADADGWEPPAARAAWLMAANTSQADCERDPDGTRRINVEANLLVAERLQAAGTFVVFPSTNVVFDGTEPFVDPGAERVPLNEYGRQRAEVEDGILAGGGAILRLTKVWHGETPLCATWHRQVTTGEPIRAFHDMVMAPVTLRTATEALVVLGLGARAGIHQLSGSRDISYADAARFLARQWNGDDDAVVECSWRDTTEVAVPPPEHTTLAVTPPLIAPDPEVALMGSIEQ